MASTISLLKLFATGQGLGGSYITYANDLDGNFTAIESVINQLVGEVTALQGPNAVLSRDLAEINDPDGPVGTATTGVIGEHSYRTTIAGDTTKLDVQSGSALRAGNRVSLAADAQLTGSGVSGTRWVFLQATGIPALSDTTQTTNNIASVNWNGTIFTGAVTQLAEIFPDGDAWRSLRVRPVEDSFAALTYRAPDLRLRAIERLLSGMATDAGGAAVGPIIIPGGSVSAVGLAFGDGAGVFDPDTGWYRAAANEPALAVDGDERLRFFEESGKDILLLKSTDATRDTTLRLDSSSASMQPEIEFRINGTSRWFFGVGGSPTFQYFLFDTANAQTPFAVEATSGALHNGAIAIRAEGDIDSATQPRLQWRMTAPQTITTGATGEDLSFTTEDADVKFAATPGASVDVPTSMGGFYLLSASCVWDEPAVPLSGRTLSIRVEGTAVAIDRRGFLLSATIGETAQAVALGIVLVPADTITVHVDHDHGSDVDVASARLSIIKIW